MNDTSKKVLEHAITKAIDGGWGMFGFRVDDYIPPWHIVKGGQMPTPKVVEKWVPENSLLICDYDDHYYVWGHLIFNHDFAKALWGEELILSDDRRFGTSMPTHLFRLRAMVTSNDPIKYLGENL